MDPKQFDTISRLLASHRISRRSALLAGAGVAALGVTGAAAQATPEAMTDQATPEVPTVQASPDAASEAGVPFMFVQTFGAGSLDAATEGVPNMLLVADHLAGQTLYFSDRPERVVGMVPTEEFLAGGSDDQGLGFTPTDPPNAALVLPDDKILVVELIDPQYDAATGQVRYQLHVLDDVSQIDLSLETEPLTIADAVGEFTAASLFIDDCPDGQIICYASDGSTVVGQIQSGFCYDAGAACCNPCGGAGGGDWSSICDQTFTGCNGSCKYGFNETWAC
ncbi:MAG TPA: hypothetical protein VFP05_10595 [Thermomicrobiales bacterium]|nr:hypothetical protein [Thermomicrobiales bacterium]